MMWKNDRFFEQRKKAFTKAIAAAILKDGKVKIKGMYSTKTGKTFDGVVPVSYTHLDVYKRPAYRPARYPPFAAVGKQQAAFLCCSPL